MCVRIERGTPARRAAMSLAGLPFVLHVASRGATRPCLGFDPLLFPLCLGRRLCAKAQRVQALFKFVLHERVDSSMPRDLRLR